MGNKSLRRSSKSIKLLRKRKSRKAVEAKAKKSQQRHYAAEQLQDISAAYDSNPNSASFATETTNYRQFQDICAAAMSNPNPASVAIESINLEMASASTENTLLTEIKSEDDISIEIKEETVIPEDTEETEENPFHNVQLVVKQENLPDTDEIKIEINTFNECLKSNSDNEKFITNDCVKSPKLGDTDKIDVKEEGSLVEYDYPDFDDLGSMDSNEATALNQVEACLQDDYVKDEQQMKPDGDFQYHQKDYNLDIKEESDFTVTETHLISNKVINTTSTVTNTHTGFTESQTTKTLVMQILPVTNNLELSNPEEILPTTDKYLDYKESFQLNSITGDVLSLEQEAYGLLKEQGKGKKPYGCPKCTNTYKEKYILNRHLRLHDRIEKRAQGFIKGIKTKEMNKKKKLKVELKEEKKEVKKDGYECSCSIVYKRKSRMETCLRSHSTFDVNTFPCMTCQKKFKTKEELAMHRKRLHRKKFPCKFCPTDYNSRKELFKHLQIHQRVQLMEYKVISEVVKGKQKLKCFMCKKTYTELSDLKSHVMDDHKEPYTCRHCKNTFSKIIDFGHHTKTYHPEVEGQSVLDVLEAFSKLVQAWKCEECGLQFHEADKLAKHLVEAHSPDLKAESQFQCTDCRRVFVSQKGLTSHRRIHHSTETVEVAEPEEVGVMCLECRKMCKDMNALVSHMRFHSPDRKYPCKFCDFRFATPEKRKTHAEIHTGDMKYVCFICEYQCSSENRLKHHKLSTKHLSMKEFLLTGKPVENTQPEVPLKKRRESSESSESEVACDICGDKFANESEMLEHKQTHPFIEFPNDDKPSRIFFK